MAASGDINAADLDEYMESIAEDFPVAQAQAAAAQEERRLNPNIRRAPIHEDLKAMLISFFLHYKAENWTVKQRNKVLRMILKHNLYKHCARPQVKGVYTYFKTDIDIRRGAFARLLQDTQEQIEDPTDMSFDRMVEILGKFWRRYDVAGLYQGLPTSLASFLSRCELHAIAKISGTQVPAEKQLTEQDTEDVNSLVYVYNNLFLVVYGNVWYSMSKIEQSEGSLKGLTIDNVLSDMEHEMLTFRQQMRADTRGYWHSHVFGNDALNIEETTCMAYYATIPPDGRGRDLYPSVEEHMISLYPPYTQDVYTRDDTSALRRMILTTLDEEFFSFYVSSIAMRRLGMKRESTATTTSTVDDADDDEDEDDEKETGDDIASIKTATVLEDEDEDEDEFDIHRLETIYYIAGFCFRGAVDVMQKQQKTLLGSLTITSANALREGLPCQRCISEERIQNALLCVCARVYSCVLQLEKGVVSPLLSNVLYLVVAGSNFYHMLKSRVLMHDAFQSLTDIVREVLTANETHSTTAHSTATAVGADNMTQGV
jgi:hypothetical protein